MTLLALLEEMMDDEGFKRFLAQPRHISLHSVEKPEPLESTLQLVKTQKALAETTRLLAEVNEKQADIQITLERLITSIQGLVDNREHLQALERQVLTGVLKELGLSG